MSTTKPWADRKYLGGIKWLAVSSILAVVSVGGWWIYHSTVHSVREPIEVRVIKVQRDSVSNTLNESGVVELGNQQILEAPADAIVEKVLVKVGDRIRVGQQLVILYDAQGQTALAEHQLELRKQELLIASQTQALASLERQLVKEQEYFEILSAQYNNLDQTQLIEQNLQLQEAELDLANWQTKVVEAQAKLAAEQKKLQTDEELFEEGFISENEVQQQREVVRSAQSQLRETRLSVSKGEITLQTQRLSQQRWQKRIAAGDSETQQQMQRAAEQVQQVQNQLQSLQGDMRQEQLELQRLRLERQKLEQKLTESIITAPVSGMVLQLPLKRGDVVKQSEDRLITLGDPRQEIVKLQLSTLNAQKVKLNQKALVSIIGPQATTFNGRVRSISLQATSGDNNRGGSGQATVSAIVELDRPSNTLIPGSQANVEIILEQRDDIVALGTEAIQQPDSQPFVWILNDSNQAEKRPVQLGLEGLTRIEVKSGLKPGETVILPPLESVLAPGTPVVVAP